MSCASSTTAKSNGDAAPFLIMLREGTEHSRDGNQDCACNSSLTALKIAQSAFRCVSFSLVLRPSRTTSRYASQESNCQPSTTCSHSVIKNDLRTSGRRSSPMQPESTARSETETQSAACRCSVRISALRWRPSSEPRCARQAAARYARAAST